MKFCSTFLLIAALSGGKCEEGETQVADPNIDAVLADDDLLDTELFDEDEDIGSDVLEAQGLAFVEPVAAAKGFVELEEETTVPIHRSISDLDLEASLRKLDLTIPNVPLPVLTNAVWTDGVESNKELKLHTAFGKADQIAYLAASIAYVVGSLLPPVPARPESTNAKATVAKAPKPTPKTPPTNARGLFPIASFVEGKIPVFQIPTPPPTSNNDGWGFLGAKWPTTAARAPPRRLGKMSYDEKSKIWNWYISRVHEVGLHNTEAQSKLVEELFSDVLVNGLGGREAPDVIPRAELEALFTTRVVPSRNLGDEAVKEVFLGRVRHGAYEAERYLTSLKTLHPLWFEAASLFLSSLSSKQRDDLIHHLERLDTAPAEAQFSAFLEQHPVAADLKTSALLLYRLQRALIAKQKQEEEAQTPTPPPTSPPQNSPAKELQEAPSHGLFANAAEALTTAAQYAKPPPYMPPYMPPYPPAYPTGFAWAPPAFPPPPFPPFAPFGGMFNPFAGYPPSLSNPPEPPNGDQTEAKVSISFLPLSFRSAEPDAPSYDLDKIEEDVKHTLKLPLRFMKDMHQIFTSTAEA